MPVQTGKDIKGCFAQWGGQSRSNQKQLNKVEPHMPQAMGVTK